MVKPIVMEDPYPLWLRPYSAGRQTVRYDSLDYIIPQILSVLPLYGTLYRFGGKQAEMEQYDRNSQWNGLVVHPGSTSYGGYGSLSSDMLAFVSDNLKQLYR